MVDAGDSSFPIPNSFKPSPRSSFKVSHILLSKGWAMIGPVGNLHLGSPERGDVSQRGNTAKRIGTQSSTMAHQGREIIAIVPLENGAFCTIFSENFYKF
jgi:hypothetical protein